MPANHPPASPGNGGETTLCEHGWSPNTGLGPCVLCNPSLVPPPVSEGEEPTPAPVPAGEPMPDPREAGCLCGRCGRRYRVDVQVPDALWSSIAGDTSLLCPRCIADGLEARGEFDAFRLVAVSAGEPTRCRDCERTISLDCAMKYGGQCLPCAVHADPTLIGEPANTPSAPPSEESPR